MRFSSILLASIILLIASCSEPQSDEPIPPEEWTAEENYKAAKDSLKAQNLDAALHHVRLAIHIDSSVYEYHEFLTESLYLKGDTAGAHAELELIFESDYEFGKVDKSVKEIVAWEIKHKNLDEVHNLIKMDLLKYKDDSVNFLKIFNFAFNTYVEIGDTNSAIELAERTLEDHPEIHDPYRLLGELAYRKADYRHARKHFDKYIENASADGDTYYHAALSNLKSKHKSKAKEYFLEGAKRGHEKCCNNYREMTAKTRYSVSSECCDGTTSSSTGRGTCSHHGGVCATIHTPYKEYTYRCN